jgi:hypothetical protein
MATGWLLGGSGYQPPAEEHPKMLIIGGMKSFTGPFFKIFDTKFLNWKLNCIIKTFKIENRTV